MNLSGNFKNFELSKLLQLLAMDKATGELSLRNGNDLINIVMKNGDVIDVDNASENKYERMGRVLIESGRLTTKEYGIILEEHSEHEVDMGEVLLKYGVLTKRQFRELGYMIYSEILVNALGWSDGTYEFTQRDVSLPIMSIKAISIQMFLLDAFRQEDSWAYVKQYVPVMDMIFRPSLKSVAEGNWQAFLQTLSPKDRSIAEHIDGNNTITMISYKSFRSVFDVSYVISELSRRGLIVRSSMTLMEDINSWPDGYFKIQAEPKPSIIIAVAAFLIFMIIFVSHFYGFNIMESFGDSGPDQVSGTTSPGDQSQESSE